MSTSRIPVARSGRQRALHPWGEAAWTGVATPSSTVRILASSSPGVKGLGRKPVRASSSPGCNPSSAYPETKRTGSEGRRRRSALAVARPSMTGMTRSVTRMLVWSMASAPSSSVSAPFPATMTRYPALRSDRARRSRSRSSSSTRRTVSAPRVTAAGKGRGASAGDSRERGNRISNTVPRPGSLSTWISPRLCFTIP